MLRPALVSAFNAPSDVRPVAYAFAWVRLADYYRSELVDAAGPRRLRLRADVEQCDAQAARLLGTAFAFV